MVAVPNTKTGNIFSPPFQFEITGEFCVHGLITQRYLPLKKKVRGTLLAKFRVTYRVEDSRDMSEPPWSSF